MVLVAQRFDVFLDRFQIGPGADFVERIEDELVDKAMVVVIETERSVMSRWVNQELNTARARGLGCVAVNLTGAPEFSEIASPARCRVDDDAEIARFIVAQHRLNSSLDVSRSSIDSCLTRRRRRCPAQRHANSLRLPGDTRNGDTCAFIVRPRPADLHRFRLADQTERADQQIARSWSYTHARSGPIAAVTCSGLETAEIVEVDEGRSNDEILDIVEGDDD